MEYSEIGLNLKYKHYERMLNDVRSRTPEEACGLVAGLNRQSEKIYVITNMESSPYRFRMAPEEQLLAFNDIESRKLELLAIYHSHPNGPISPSPTDITEFAYPETVYLIWSRVDSDWICRGYQITDRDVREVPVKILGNEELSE